MSNAIDIKISKNILLDAINNIQAVVENRNTIEILGNVKINAVNNNLIISATDMNVLISKTIDADVKIEGTLTVDARKLFDIVRKSPNDVDIVIRGNSDQTGKIQVKPGNSRFTLSCLPADQFPFIEFETNSTSRISANELISSLNKVKFAASTDEAKYTLNGISLKCSENELKFTATNAHKLARISLSGNYNNFIDILLPMKTTLLFLKAFNAVEDIEIDISESKIYAEQGNCYIISKLIDSKFPDIDNIIPNDLTNRMSINKPSLLSAIDRISLFSDKKQNMITFNINDSVLTLLTKNLDNEEAIEDLEVTTELNDFKINFNYKYLLEILNTIESDTVNFYFNNINQPTVIKDDNYENELFLVMSMND